MKTMKKINNHSKPKHKNKQPFNMYAWGQKNKKLFASVICFMVVLGLLVSLVQI